MSLLFKKNVQRFQIFALKRFMALIPTPKSCNVKVNVPTKTLNNGQKMPILGLGTAGSAEDEVQNAVQTAIKIGYRLIDTALIYGNEKYVGKGIQKMIKDKVIKREDIFITSKLWNTHHRHDLVKKACRSSLNDLQLDYMDLYLIHWPMAYFDGDVLYPYDSCGRIKVSNVDYIETWKAMEELQKDGLVKSIGISNFNRTQIERLLKEAKIPPAVLQCECHPYLTQKKLIKYCQSKNIAFMAYSPLGSSPTRRSAIKGEDRLLEAPEVQYIANYYEKTPAQILLRYQLQLGNIFIPKSIHKSEIENNFQIFDFKLTKIHMADLDSMNRNHRYIHKIEEAGKHKHFPFWDEY